MNILLVRPTVKARRNFESRLKGQSVAIFECNSQEEVRSILDSPDINLDMVLIFLDKIDSELIWMFGMVMDHNDLRVVGLTEGEAVDIRLDENVIPSKKKRTKLIYN